MNQFKQTLFVFTLIFTVVFQSYAQDNMQIDLPELQRETKKEKLRKPIKISDALKAYELQEKAINGKNKRSTEVKISSNSNAQIHEGEAFIAMDPTNNDNLVMSFMNNNSQTGMVFPVYTSNNAGQTWIKSSFNTLMHLANMYPNSYLLGGGDPVFAFDKTGKLYFSWIYLVGDINSPDTSFVNMFWASSIDYGTTWTVQQGKDKCIGISAIDLNIFQAYPNSEGMYDRQWFATDMTNGPNENTLYCSFVYFPNMVQSQSLYGQYVKKKLPGSATFNTTKSQVNSGQSQFGNIVVTHDGKLHITYADLANNSIKHSVSSDGGNTFSTPNTIATGTNLYGNQGGGYVHDQENCAVNLVASGNNLYVVWTDFPSFAGPNFNSYFSHSSDGGLTWSTPTDLSVIFGTSGKGLMPTVCAHNDKVSIGTYTINNLIVSDYYMVTSTNNGMTWGVPTKLSTQSTDFTAPSNYLGWFGDYFNAVRNDTKVYNIWSDGRGASGPKMYVSVTTENGTVWPVGFNEITPINATFSLEQYYPNPVQDILNLDFSAKAKNRLSIQLISMDGKVVKEQIQILQIGSTKIHINMNGFAKGSYVLKLKNEDNTILSRLITKN